MTKTNINRLTTACAALACMAAVGPANAITFSYGAASSTIDNLVISADNAAFTLTNRVQGGTSRATAGHNRGEDTPNDNNFASGNFTTPLGAGNTQMQDPGQALAGSAQPGTAENAFGTFGGETGSYGRGDGLITATGTAGTFSPSIQLFAIAESYRDLSSGATPSDGTRPAGGSGTNRYSTTFVAGADTGLSFSFDATPFLEVQLEDGGAILGSSQTTGGLGFNIQIQDISGAAPVLIFEWTPDGVQGVFLGGSDAAADGGLDPFRLDPEFTALTDNEFIFNPGLGSFFAVSDANILTAGTEYSLLIDLEASTSSLIAANVAPPVPVPLPGSIVLLGLGLAGLTVRRKKAA